VKKYIFITHSSHDATTATKIRDYLEANGIQCWIAPRDIPVGEEWAEAILEGIENASGMLLVFSSNSNNSRQVRREIERAIHNNIPIFPIRIEKIEPSKAMEYYISSNHWMDVFGGDLEISLDKLVKTIKTKLSIIEISADTSEEKPVIPSLQDGDNTVDSKSKPSFSNVTLLNRLFSFIKVNRKLIILLCIAFSSIIALFLGLPFLSEDEPVVEESIEIASNTEELFAKIISEEGMILSCTSIQQTFDNGFLLTGRRVPEDTIEIWREIWVKKLDVEGNEEWEFTNRDTLGVAYDSSFEYRILRSMHSVQLPDSSFACSYSLAIADTLEASTEINPSFMHRFGINQTPSSDLGVGFTLKQLDSAGDVLLQQDFLCNRGAWETCRVRDLLVNQEGGIGVYYTLRNVRYFGVYDTVLFFTDIYAVTSEKPIQNLMLTGSDLSDVYLDEERFKFLQGNYANGFYILPRELEPQSLELDSRPEGAYFLSPTSRDAEILFRFIDILSWNRDSLLALSYSIGEPRFDYHFMEFDFSGNIVHMVKIPGLHSTISSGKLLSTGDVIFAGSTLDSLGVRKPYFGSIDGEREIAFERTVPLEGGIIDMDVLCDGKLCFAINCPLDIALLTATPEGYYNINDIRSIRASYRKIIETWSNSNSDILRDWSFPRNCFISDLEERGKVLEISTYSGRTANILLNTTFNLDWNWICIYADVFIANPIINSGYVRLGLFSSKDYESEVDSSYASIKWNFTIGEEGFTTNTFATEKFISNESELFRYGEWNRFSLSIDSLIVDYSINDVLVLRDTLTDSAFDQEALFRIEGSSEVPFYVDSVVIREFIRD